MISLDDPRWAGLEGGYRVPYDPRPALRQLEADADQSPIWKELWNELHHQGDIGAASYAAIPILVEMHRRHHRLDWNLYALASTIEIERHRSSNPGIPEWLGAEYKAAWQHLVDLALHDLKAGTNPDLIQSALAVVALGKGELKLGAILAHLDSGELADFLDEHMSWTDSYREGAV